ncbi:hypothetical protein H1R20_g11013, partial [Candolleomyces eurysporus]
MDPNSTSPNELVARYSEAETVLAGSLNLSLPSSVCTRATSASDMVLGLGSEGRSEKQEPPGMISSNARRYRVCPNTLTLDNGPTNTWYYRECRVPLIRHYDNRPCSLEGDSSMSSSPCSAPTPMPPGGDPDDNLLHQAFFMGSTTKNDEVRKTWADSLVYSKQNPSNWTDNDLQELSRAFAFRAIDTYEGPFDSLLDFILVLCPYFRDPSSKKNPLANALEHEVGNIFSFTWKAESEESVNPQTAHHDRYVAGALNLAKFMGDLFGLGLHIEALRHLVIHAGPSLWDDSDWSGSEIYMTAITQIVPSALNSRSLYDFLPERGGSGQGTPKSISEEAVAAIESRAEAYTLTVPADGSEAVLTASSSLGLFRGLTTFGQLWYDLDGATYSLQAPISINDSPAYPYRGFMLDTARNYFPIADIKRTLDAMSWVKINTLHWHVVDSQSFPLVVPGFNVISEKGAYHSKAIYTPADVKEIVDYAAARGIDVLAEIDTPGHTSIIHHSFPEHIACFEAAPWTQFANEPPAGQLRLASPATVNFTASLLSAASQLFPSKFFSTGGDEINANCYRQDPQTQRDLAAQGKTLEQALDTFTQASHRALASVGKTPVVWQEMLLDHNVTLSKDTVIMVWISSQNVAAVAREGHRLVHAASDFFYLDCGGGGWVGANTNGNSWCDPFKTWQKSYSFNPVAGLTEAQKKLVLGGQHLLWAEQAGPSNLDSIVWPRAASSAELFWTGPGGNARTALPRLHDIAYRFVQRGVRAIPLQPEWCALRPGKCDLDA